MLLQMDVISSQMKLSTIKQVREIALFLLQFDIINFLNSNSADIFVST
jgi:hypothetical protein